VLLAQIISEQTPPGFNEGFHWNGMYFFSVFDRQKLIKCTGVPTLCMHHYPDSAPTLGSLSEDALAQSHVLDPPNSRVHSEHPPSPLTVSPDRVVPVNTKLGPRAPKLVTPKDKRIRLKNFAPYDQDQIRKTMALYFIALLTGQAFDESRGYRPTASSWRAVMDRNKSAGEQPIMLTADIVTLVSWFITIPLLKHLHEYQVVGRGSTFKSHLAEDVRPIVVQHYHFGDSNQPEVIQANQAKAAYLLDDKI
jgi:hypothetical protein